MKAIASIKVDFIAGTSVKDCVTEMIALAGRVGARIECGINGVEVWAEDGDDPEDIGAAYQHEMMKGEGYRIASAYEGRELRATRKYRKRRP